MKKQINSKTVWFNIVMFIMFIATLVDTNILNVFGITDVTKVVTIQGMITAIGNYILRVFFTSQQITTQNDRETK
jgi:hypothetical protein